MGTGVGLGVGTGVGHGVGLAWAEASGSATPSAEASGSGWPSAGGVGVAVGLGVGLVDVVARAVGLTTGEGLACGEGDVDGKTDGDGVGDAAGNTPLRSPPCPKSSAQPKIAMNTTTISATHHLLAGSSISSLGRPSLRRERTVVLAVPTAATVASTGWREVVRTGADRLDDLGLDQVIVLVVRDQAVVDLILGIAIDLVEVIELRRQTRILGPIRNRGVQRIGKISVR